MKIKKHIPNAITLLNLLFGTMAVIYAVKGLQLFAVYLILAASVMDFLDGFTARALKAYSSIGKELDSLADLVSFGLAPSLLLYNRYFPISTELLSLLPLSIVLASAVRLAVFNVDTKQSKSFIGMPTPANAILVSVFIHYTLYNSRFDTLWDNLWFYPVISIILSYLLISPIPMFSLKFSSLSFKENKIRFLFIGASALTIIPVILLKERWSLWLLLIFISYIITNISVYIAAKVSTVSRKN